MVEVEIHAGKLRVNQTRLIYQLQLASANPRSHPFASRRQRTVAISPHDCIRLHPRSGAERRESRGRTSRAPHSIAEEPSKNSRVAAYLERLATSPAHMACIHF